MGFRDEMVSLRDSLLTDLGADGLVFGQESPVYLLTITAPTEAEAATGEAITATVSRVVMAPAPQVKRKVQTRAMPDGQIYKIADAVLTVSRVFTEATLAGAAGFELDGQVYDLVEGGLEKRGLTWRMLIKLRGTKV